MLWWKPRVDAELEDVARRRLALLGEQLTRSRGEGNPAGTDTRPVEPVAPDRGAQPSRSPGRHAARDTVSTSSPVERVSRQLIGSASGSLRVTAGHLLLVGLAAAVCVALGAWMFVRARPEPIAAPRMHIAVPGSPFSSLAPAEATPSSSQSSAPAGAASAPAARLVVDVAGKVRQPGIVELPAGSRVVDALEKAGGARRGVKLSALNLARLLVDGEQLLVGIRAASVAPPPPPAGSPLGVPTSPAGLVNLNTAAQADLESLPGIGPVTALAILAWRDENGRFTSVDELLEVSGIGDATLADIRAFVTV